MVRDGLRSMFSRTLSGQQEERFRMDDPSAAVGLAAALETLGRPLLEGREGLLLVCIGTDRSIGDALGPLVGSLLGEQAGWPFHFLGTLDSPVHASNLVETLAWVESKHPRSLVIALDACLGRMESVGTITVGRGPLKPGAGVNKTLPAVGQIYVTGVVNVGGFMEYFVLQNTRLNLVMRMAKVMAEGVAQGMSALAAACRSARAAF